MHWVISCLILGKLKPSWPRDYKINKSHLLFCRQFSHPSNHPGEKEHGSRQLKRQRSSERDGDQVKRQKTERDGSKDRSTTESSHRQDGFKKRNSFGTPAGSKPRGQPAKTEPTPQRKGTDNKPGLTHTPKHTDSTAHKRDSSPPRVQGNNQATPMAGTSVPGSSSTKSTFSEQKKDHIKPSHTNYDKCKPSTSPVPSSSSASSLASNNTGQMFSSALEVYEHSLPLSFLLTKVQGIDKQYNQAYTMHIKGILSPSMGNLQRSAQFNYKIDIPWLVQQYHPSFRTKPLLIIHGAQREEKQV